MELAVKETLIGEVHRRALFDYEAIGTENRIIVQQRTVEIREIVRSTAENVIKIGGKLAEVRDRLGGRFIEWLALEFAEWSERTAYNFIAVHQAFGARNQEQIAKIATSALYLLSAPSTPPAARQAAIEMAEVGEPVTHKMAQVIVAAAKEAEPKTAELFDESEVAELPVEDELSPEERVAADEEVRAQEARIEAEEDRATSSAVRTGEHSFAEKPDGPQSATPKRDKLVAEKAATEAEKLWAESAVQINIRLSPVDDDPRGRQAIVAIFTDEQQGVVPVSRRIADSVTEWPPAIRELLLAFRQKLVEQKAAKKAAKAATKKPAAKAAKKSK